MLRAVSRLRTLYDLGTCVCDCRGKGGRRQARLCEGAREMHEKRQSWSARLSGPAGRCADVVQDEQVKHGDRQRRSFAL